MNNNKKFQTSDKVDQIPEALSIYINQLVYDQKRAKKDVTVLSLGEAFFDIPMFDFSKLDFVKGYHYSDSQGLPELRTIIADFYKEKYAADVDPTKELIITAGSKLAIYMAIQAVINPNDEVIIHEPAWLSYQEQIRLAGGIPKFIRYDVPVKDFAQYFTTKTRVLIINNPNNPAGRVYSLDELKALYEQCAVQGIYILIDEAYSDFVTKNEFHSMAKVVPSKKGIIIVNSLSKNMGMSGWRVGYTITSADLMPQLLKLNQHLITCAPTILQYYMARYFNEITAITLPQVADIVKKRERIAKVMDQIGLKRMRGNSTFYFLIDIEDYPDTSLVFAKKLLFEHQISVVPGIAYGHSCSRFIRVGIGAESEERIIDALRVIKDHLYESQVKRKAVVSETVISE
jgi:aspartate aminotransferase/aminotransferase